MSDEFAASVLIPGARMRSKKDAMKVEEAILAMRAAIDVGHYRVAESIRRDHLLLVCSLCGENWPKTEPFKKRFKRIVSEKGDGIVVCGTCMQQRVGDSIAHFPDPDGPWHQCHRINVPGRIVWACEL